MGRRRRRTPLRVLVTPWRQADGRSDISSTSPEIIYSSTSLRKSDKTHRSLSVFQSSVVFMTASTVSAVYRLYHCQVKFCNSRTILFGLSIIIIIFNCVTLLSKSLMWCVQNPVLLFFLVLVNSDTAANTTTPQ